MSKHLYSFILKTKQGEFGGLRQAGILLRDIGRPHFDVTKSTDESSLEKHLSDIAIDISRSWPVSNDFYLDIFDIPLSWRTSGHCHPLRYIADRLLEGQLFPIRLIPTTGLEIERDAAYVATAKEIAARVGCGLCLRLKPEEIDHFDESAILAETLLRSFSGDCDLMLDFRSIVNQDIERLATRGVRMIRALEQRNLKFREIIVCSSNIPEKVSELVDKESRWNQPRAEWELWETVTSALRREHIVYADYCTVFPEFFAPQQNRFINAKLRITDRDHYRLYRGRELYTVGGDPLQYRDLANEVLELDGIRRVGSKAIDDFRELASGRSRRVGSPASIVPMEICLHLDVTAQEVSERIHAVMKTSANQTT